MLQYNYILSLYLSNIAFILVIPYVIVTTTHEDFSNVPIGFPSFICTTRNSDFLVIYLLFPVIFLCSLGVFLLSIIIFNIQMVSHKRENSVLLLFTVNTLGVILHGSHGNIANFPWQLYNNQPCSSSGLSEVNSGKITLNTLCSVLARIFIFGGAIHAFKYI